LLKSSIIRLNTYENSGVALRNYIKKDVRMLENLVYFYQKSNGETKKNAAIQHTTPIQVLLNLKGVLDSGKTKKEVNLTSF
jgi:hypothetical protein